MFLARPNQQSAHALPKNRILAQIGVAVFTLLATASARAQTLSYTVRIEAPGPLEELLNDNLDLVRWRGNPRLDRNQLQRLVRNTPDQVRTLVATEGYYSPTVSATLDTGGAEPVARVLVEPGQPVLVGDVELVLTGFEPISAGGAKFDQDALRAGWSIKTGQRFRQADWETAKRTLLRQAMQLRYPRAQLTESSATVDPDLHRALLHVVVDSGPPVQFGGLHIEGLKRYPAAIISNLNQIHPGDEYSEAVLQAFQARLQDTGYFSGVEVNADLGALLDEHIGTLTDEQKAAAPEPAAAASGPVTTAVLVRVTENKEKNVALGLGYSTNTGKRTQVTYEDLAVFGLRMKSNLILETLRQSARTDFFLPTSPEGYNDSVGAGFERTDLEGERTSVATLAARRSWGAPRLERSLTLEFLSEQRNVDGQATTSASKSVPLTYSITKRALDNLLSPTSGYVVSAQLGGAVLPVLTDERFLRATGRFINYRPIGSSGTLVLRGEAGALISRRKEGVPSTVLFRAGGDQSVRGYAYQELGVADGTAIVPGRYLLTGSVEYQYWFKPPYGVAVFYDAGNAADTLRTLTPKSGYGIGARWRSPVGPINVDVAYGHAVKQVRLHFSLGFTF